MSGGIRQSWIRELLACSIWPASLLLLNLSLLQRGLRIWQLAPRIRGKGRDLRPATIARLQALTCTGTRLLTPGHRLFNHWAQCPPIYLCSAYHNRAVNSVGPLVITVMHITSKNIKCGLSVNRSWELLLVASFWMVRWIIVYKITVQILGVG